MAINKRVLRHACYYFRSLCGTKNQLIKHKIFNGFGNYLFVIDFIHNLIIVMVIFVILRIIISSYDCGKFGKFGLVTKSGFTTR